MFWERTTWAIVQQFEGQTSCVMWFFRDMLHSTKSTYFTQIYYIFIYGKMCFASGWYAFAGRNCPAGRRAENPDLDYEEEWWQHTPLWESHTNAERLWCNSVDRETIFWAGKQLLVGQQETPVNAVFKKTPLKAFYVETGRIFTPGRQNMCRLSVFGMLPGFLENLLESGNLFCIFTATTKTALGIIQLWFNCFLRYLTLFLEG